MRWIAKTQHRFFVIHLDVEEPDDVEADDSVDLEGRPLSDLLRFSHSHHRLVDDHRRHVADDDLAETKLRQEPGSGNDPAGTRHDLESVGNERSNSAADKDQGALVEAIIRRERLEISWKFCIFESKYLYD